MNLENIKLKKIVFSLLLFLTFFSFKPIVWSEDGGSQNFYIVFLWHIGPEDIKRVDEYTNLLETIVQYPSTKICFSISPQVFNSWLHSSPDLIAKLKSLYNSKRISIVFSPWQEIVIPMLINFKEFTEAINNLKDVPNIDFVYPQDVREQMVRSWQLFNREFSTYPIGMVPPYGAVSPQTIELLSTIGVRWIVSPETILGQIEYLPLINCKVNNQRLLVFIREPHLSKTIESPDILTNPQDLIKSWWKQVVGYQQQSMVPGVVVLINGAFFWTTPGEYTAELLQQLVLTINKSRNVVSLFPEECLKQNMFPPILTKFPTVTWTDNSFTSWVGDKYQNIAWALLARTRKTFEDYKNSGKADISVLDKTMDEIFYAEDSFIFSDLSELSDTEKRRAAEQRFRQHLINVYRTIGFKIPSDLNQPLGESSIISALDNESMKFDTVINTEHNHFVFSDATGDDYGDGTYLYPKLTSLSPGTFDLHKFVCDFDEDFIDFSFVFANISTATFSEPIGIQVYIDMNNRVGAGLTTLLPGCNAFTRPENAWEYCISIINKSSTLCQAGINNYKSIGTYEVVFSTEVNREYKTKLPRTALRGSPYNWRYLILVTGVTTTGQIMKVTETATINSFGGAIADKTPTSIIDLIPPVGKSQKIILEFYKTGQTVELPFINIK